MCPTGSTPTTSPATAVVRDDRRGGRRGPRATTTQTATRTERQRPSFGITMFSVLLPVGLMMGKALVDIFIDDKGNPLRQPSTFLAVRSWRC